MAAITDEQIKEAFTLFDATESGTLSAEELALALKGLGFGNISADEASQFISDANNNGTEATEAGDENTTSAAAAANASTSNAIDFERFAALVKSKMAAQDSEEEIQKAFSLFLGKDSGKTSIDLEALLAVAQRLGQKDDEAILKEIIAEATADRNGDAISFEDFARVMEQMKGK